MQFAAGRPNCSIAYRSNSMNIYPYVYRIDHPSGEFYIGYRCANKVPASKDLGIKYKTNARHLSYPFNEYALTIVAEFYLLTAKDDAYDFEQSLINEHWGNPLLANKNCRCGSKARFSNAGKQHSVDAKIKISNARKSSRCSEETWQKMSETRKGQLKSEETKKRMSDAKIGKKRKPFTEEHRRKLAVALEKRRSNRMNLIV